MTCAQIMSLKQTSQNAKSSIDTMLESELDSRSGLHHIKSWTNEKRDLNDGLGPVETFSIEILGIFEDERSERSNCEVLLLDFVKFRLPSCRSPSCFIFTPIGIIFFGGLPNIEFVQHEKNECSNDATHPTTDLMSMVSL